MSITEKKEAATLAEIKGTVTNFQGKNVAYEIKNGYVNASLYTGKVNDESTYLQVAFKAEGNEKLIEKLKIGDKISVKGYEKTNTLDNGKEYKSIIAVGIETNYNKVQDVPMKIISTEPKEVLINNENTNVVHMVLQTQGENPQKYHANIIGDEAIDKFDKIGVDATDKNEVIISGYTREKEISNKETGEVYKIQELFVDKVAIDVSKNREISKENEQAKSKSNDAEMGR